ncbi:MAG: hypothetical protein U0793_33130 [Gemmataceae bacterium]
MNVCREKKLTRTSARQRRQSIILKPPRAGASGRYIEEDESWSRSDAGIGAVRKIFLKENDRKRFARAAAKA